MPGTPAPARRRPLKPWPPTAAQALGADAQLVAYALAALGEGQAPQASPRDYVRRLFDEYAPQFDGHLRDTLGYRTPSCWSAGPALRRPSGARRARPGCGTGLCGPLLRPAARSLAGRRSQRQHGEQARLRSCSTAWPAPRSPSICSRLPLPSDLAVAADVLVYIGDLWR